MIVKFRETRLRGYLKDFTPKDLELFDRRIARCKRHSARKWTVQRTWRPRQQPTQKQLQCDFKAPTHWMWTYQLPDGSRFIAYREKQPPASVILVRDVEAARMTG